MYEKKKTYTKKEMEKRIKYLMDTGFNEEVATAIATFEHNGISFAIPI